ncbi:MAG: hypothetical protein ACXQTS_00675 [Candidatus Methanospirareceae archaeon]
MTTPKKAPDWLNLYIERYKRGEITIEDILEEENKRRAAEGMKPLKLLSVKRAINMAGLSIKRAEKGVTEVRAEKEVEKGATIEKPCRTCKHYKLGVCVYPDDLFKHYNTLEEFSKDLSEGRCKLKTY